MRSNEEHFLRDLASRCMREPDLTLLPPAWRAPLAKIAQELSAASPFYKLDQLTWTNKRLMMAVHPHELECCAAMSGFEDLDEHLEAETPEHRSARELSEVSHQQLREVCARAQRASAYWGQPARPKPLDARPVVALDIDGVLNPFAPRPLPRFKENGEWYVIIGNHRFPSPSEEVLPRVRDGLAVATIHVPAGTSENPFFAGSRRAIDVQVRFDPDVTEWVRKLHDHAEVVWATTWEQAANLFATAAGMPHAAVGADSAVHPPRFGYIKDGDSASWKAEALAESFSNRPLVWVDDLAGRHRRDMYWRHPDDVVKTLVVVPEQHVGITPAQMTEIDMFLEHWRDQH